MTDPANDWRGEALRFWFGLAHERWWKRDDALDAEMRDEPDRFTPWLKLEWLRLRSDFQDALPPRRG